MSQGSKTFRVFVSSTFSDLKEERNALQQYVFPRLSELAKNHGCRFQAIDLRWGISEEAGLDQRTMQICLNELARCQKSSPRPNFIVLLGDRYGWEPLPEEIPESEYAQVLRVIASNTDLFDAISREDTEFEALTLLERWYRLDMNAVPPVYVLQSRSGPFKDFTIWEKTVEQPLRKILRQAVKKLDLPDEALIKYQTSATHQEIVWGAMKVEDARQHVFGFFRSITKIGELTSHHSDMAAKGFIDSDSQGQFDGNAYNKLSLLKKSLVTKIGQANVFDCNAHWTNHGVATEHIGNLPDMLEACEALLEGNYIPRNMCEAVWCELATLIKKEVAQIEAVDPLDLENLTHAAFRKDRTKVFMGRKTILNEIDRYVNSDGHQPLVIHGISGTGKSALLAKAVDGVSATHKERINHAAVVIERYIGVTPESTNIRYLLEDLCKIITRAYDEDTFDIPEDINKLEQAFKDRLELATADKPLIIFLDALDQLTRTDSSLNLTWLPSEIPPHVKLIVSTLSEPDFFPSALQSKILPENILKLELLSPQYGEEALDLWLQLAGRTLQDTQRQEVLDKYTRCGLPLYLKLAVEEASKWRSYDGIPEYEGRPGLAEDISGIIRNLFWRLALPVNHGNLLIERSLGYLAAAKNGLTEDEMLDVLSSDEEFYAQFKHGAYHELTEERLPVIVWSRLFFDLAPYLTERKADGTMMLVFFHRQLLEVSRIAFLAGDSGIRRHNGMAAYFGDQELYIGGGDQRKPNLRKLSELPYQQTRGKQWEAIVATLTDLHFIEAKCSAGKTYELIVDYHRCIDVLPGFQKEKKREGQRAYRMDAYTKALMAYCKGETSSLAIIPSVEIHCGEGPKEEEKADDLKQRDVLRAFLAFVLAESHALVSFSGYRGFCLQQAYNSASNGSVAVKAEREINAQKTTGFILHHPSHRPNYCEYPQLVRTLEGHTDTVFCVKTTPCGKLAISGGRDNTLRLWDIGSGVCKKILKKHSGSILCVDITPDGRFAVSGGMDQSLCVWELKSGDCIYALAGHDGFISSVAVSPDGTMALSGGKDGKLKVWDLSIGKLIKELDGHSDHIASVSMTADGKLAVSGGRDNTFCLWDLNRMYCFQTFEYKNYEYTNVCITPDGKTVVCIAEHASPSYHYKNLVQVLDMNTGHIEKKMVKRKGKTGEFISITPDGKLAVTQSGDRDLVVCNLEKGTCVTDIKGYEMPRCVSLLADGRAAISGSENGVLRLWDLEKGTHRIGVETHKDKVATVCIAAGSNRIVSGGGEDDREIRFWEFKTGEHRKKAKIKSLIGSGIDCIQAVPGGKLAASLYFNKLHVWDISRGKCLNKIKMGVNAVKSISITPDGRRVVGGSNKGMLTIGNDTIRVCDLERAKPLKLLETVKSGMDDYGEIVVCVEPSGKRLLSWHGDRMFRKWDIESGTCLQEFAAYRGEVFEFEFSPDGRMAAAVGIHSVRLLDFERGQSIKVIERSHADSMVVNDKLKMKFGFVPDGRRAVTYGGDHRLNVWDVATWECIGTIALPFSKGFDVDFAFTPDGKKILAIVWDVICLVDLNTCDTLAVYQGSSRISAVSRVSADGRIVCGMLTGEVKILCLWNCALDHPVVTAGRLWMHGKRRRFLGKWQYGKTAESRWDRNITATCPWCDGRFPVGDETRKVFDEISPTSTISSSQSPCQKLPEEAWNDPRLLSECPLCRQPFKYNPFIVDNKD
jgi:WD40 repeat protein